MDTVAMETDGNEETAGTKPLSPGRGELARGNQTQGAAIHASSECTNTTDAEQSSGKLKKTAFKLFGGRKNICTLPSFFTIKNKGQVKGPSKKGIAKSKTHSGISEVVLDINQKERSDTGWIGYTDSPGCNSAAARTLCGSKSEHSALDNNVNSNLHKGESLQSENSECFAQKQNTDKPSSVRRSKKGLRGLFSSIRRHKKNKAIDSTKENPLDSNCAADFTHMEQMTAGEEGVCAEFKKGLGELNLKPACKMNHPVTGDSVDKNVIANSTSSSSKSCSIKIENSLKNKRRDFETSSAEVRKASPVEIKTLREKAGTVILNMDTNFGSMPDIGKPKCLDHDPPSVHSFDHISLIFGDVTSLKSFDSLTGCGDITADHDDDSIAESTVSGERGRTAGKRSSCLVTYQGGGEEMATPDEVDDEYLKALWMKATGATIIYGSSQNIAEDGGECPRSPSDVEHTALHISLADPCALRGITDSAINSSELVTPQSDHQESAPNSDEGYYDSTTPGHDEEEGDSISQSKNEQLPRDSYSGDALYELFVEQNDSLMNSPPSDEQSLETKPLSLATSFAGILNFPMPGGINVSHIPNKQAILLPLGQDKLDFIPEDEIRLAHLQQLTCWEPGGKTALEKGLAFQEKDMFFGDVHNTDLNNIAAETDSIIAKSQQDGLSTEPLVSYGLSRNGQVKDDYLTDIADEHNWTDLLGSRCLEEANNIYMEGRQNVCGNYSNTNLQHQMSGENYTEEYKSRNCDEWEQQMKEVENQGLKNVASDNISVKGAVDDSCGNVSSCNIAGKAEEQCEQAINYSQALVEFTANRKLYPILSDSLGSSGSGSHFAKDIHALPAMVTFDVVDVENEGECDQQSEMVTDEEISASYETFDNNYMAKELYHHCDDRMFHICAQNSFLGNCWGAASLPRHFSLYKLSPSLPAPLSLNRRSKSLDTDSLESELIDLYLSKVTSVSKSTPQSPDVPQYKQDRKKGSVSHWFGKISGQTVSLETRETANISNCLEQQLLQHREEPLSSDERNTQSKSFCPLDTVSGTEHIGLGGDLSLYCQSNSIKLPVQNLSAKQHLEPIINNKMLHSSRKLVRPTHLPLQNDSCMLQSGTVSFNSSRENTNGKQAYISPSLNERQKDDFSKTVPSVQYSGSDSELDAKGYRDVGLPLALPPFCSNKTESLKHSMNFTGLYTTANNSMFKGRSDLEVKLPVGWIKNTTMDV
ncbi:APC membrane recruitment protein 1 [Chiloscyllium plagiosum]|uniref:APC membrane recruitment protein 1 n=1 Tax=Chiloscyllium plagiosum TaxID=36176 RepID=UPI001CB7FD2B|nr:APC membrane recruitment protein 1 [Chiloscyllium plagiosum]XP_043560783.1 APC membrane recruitment protein 1 [Chiloscyllium plagiosum]XP_043560784.1 APC membrane recruitment protein 1 [Chiloscyllium plagiosum]